MKIEVLEAARQDLVLGYQFYEKQVPGLGSYFLDSLFSDIDSLLLYYGIHPKIFGAHRSLSKRFPFAIYYRVADGTIRILAVLDCRRNPARARRRLSDPQP